MCLIALAHLASERFPFILAANRDEDHERASHDARFWPEAPHVLGGRDALHGGSWLAVTTAGRFAAVTNLRGAERRARSRGALVGDFVRKDVAVHDYAGEVAAHAAEYSGFHLLAGLMCGEILYITPESQRALAPGIHALSNAPDGEIWPKVGFAIEAMNQAVSIEDPTAIVDALMLFLTTPRGAGRVEDEVFIAGDRYGTRSSTVIVASADEILFAEQSHLRGGVRDGERRVFRLAPPGKTLRDL